MVVDQVAAQVLNTASHGPGEAVDGRLGLAGLQEGLGVHVGDGPSVQATKPVDQGGRPPEGPLHGHLLVKQHADQQGQRVGVQQAVGGRVAGDG